MSMQQQADCIAAIDIGTTKICVLIARLSAQGELEVMGIGHVSSQGIKKGVIVDVAQTVASITQAIKAAEAQASICIEQVVVSIAGAHIKSFNSSGVVGIKRRDVRQYDIDRVVEAAKAVPIP